MGAGRLGEGEMRLDDDPPRGEAASETSDVRATAARPRVNPAAPVRWAPRRLPS